MFWRLMLILRPAISPRWLERWRVLSARSRFAQKVGNPRSSPRRILVDLTVITRRDARTGIQRVVRSTFAELRLRSRGMIVQAMQFNGHSFCASSWPDADESKSVLIQFSEDDVVLGLDLSLDAIRRNIGFLLKQKRAGVRFWFLVYDLLPVRTPHHFSAKLAVRFRWWLIATAQLADGYMCISQHIADDLTTLLSEQFDGLPDVEICVLPMGVDPPSATRVTMQDGALALPPLKGDIVLAVGTLEPRKGYMILLDAFEQLWAAGVETSLVIVGASGWKNEALLKRIVGHAQLGQRLHWLQRVDDAGLISAYRRARLLVAASFEEGFGLPIIEAVAYECPVLARDIPAFREHSDYGLRYFPVDANAVELAAAISDCLQGRAPQAISSIKKPPAWRDTSEAVLDVLARGS